MLYVQTGLYKLELNSQQVVKTNQIVESFLKAVGY